MPQNSSLQRHLDLQKAQKLVDQGRYGVAGEICRSLLASQRSDVPVHHLLAVIAFHQSQYVEAQEHLKKCLAANPRNPLLLYEMGRVLANQGRYELALTQFEKAIELQSDYIQAIAGKADVLERMGEREQARSVLQPLMETGNYDDGVGLMWIRLLESDSDTKRAIEITEQLLSKPPTDLFSRTQLLLQAGRMYDRLGNYAKAFECFSNSRPDAGVAFNIDQYIEKFDQLIATYSDANLHMLPQASNTSELPIFIACMPRSGSTLVEQIIHAHPQAFGAGELPHITEMVLKLPELIDSFQLYPACLGDLTQAKVDGLAKSHLDALQKMAPKAKRIANKDLLLYQHLGLLTLLFPKCRVVHIRRHRMDNAFACFMAGLAPSQFPWVKDLRYIGIVWRQYERLMEHWRSTLDLPMLEVQYEDLVEDTEAQIRRIIDFCGLEWNDRCLRYWEVDRTVLTLSYDQVRKPIFKTAVKRYEKYEAFLGPLKEGLGE